MNACVCVFVRPQQLKVFPESSRTAVYSFLGIPYAQPPIGALRFAVRYHSFHALWVHILMSELLCVLAQPPKPHGGWNRTLYARNYQAICPQPEQNMYEESSSGYPFQSRMSENCLFLNVWTPEVRSAPHNSLYPKLAK